MNKVVDSEWDVRFAQIEVVALMELNQILKVMKYQGYSFYNQQNFSVDKRFIYEMDLDIRVTISWDCDNHDVELHCIEPDGEKCYSFKVRFPLYAI